MFRREGEYWTITYRGTVLRLKDAKGLRYLAQLLRNPGRDFHARDLVVAAADGGRTGSTEERTAEYSAGLGGVGPLLDPAAKTQYRERLAALGAELEEAERFNDAGRAARAREEIEAITSQLTAAVGLGGRDRSPGSAAERARLTVTKGIKSAIEKIRQSDGALARHLSSRVRTGYWCAYTPDPERPVIWTA
jgi:non-specific serine/threonine protein kinase